MAGTRNPERLPTTDPQTRAKILDRHQALALGALALPNLFLRSAITLALLYGMVGLVLITMVQFGLLGPGLAVGIGVAIILLQFALGPWFMDLFLGWLRSTHWVGPEGLPPHLSRFVQQVCDQHRMKFPSFGIIDDGAPEAFTYGHHPNNARVVISRGLTELLTPNELEAVVAHELGHARNWDMALMTIANLVPLLLYYLYQISIRVSRGRSKQTAPAMAVAIGAYVLYFVSQYLVLWFSRTREYYADRFAGEATGNPNALASALVKIAYGLAAHPSALVAAEGDEESDKSRKKAAMAGNGAWGALNIFDRNAAVNLVLCGANEGGAVGGGGLDPERVKGAMQWDLWNPWAGYYELHSTHPLVAKRLQHLSDQSASRGQPPFVVFDRVKPESYWDEFFVDLFVVMMPLVGALIGLALSIVMAAATNAWHVSYLGIVVLMLGFGMAVKNRCVYSRGVFENLTVAGLMHRVKVSPVRAVRATLTGTIIGKGVPGLIYSEDFVLRESTGILFLDYRQPLALWSFFFGLLRAGTLQGKEVRVRGWFRRAPVPYLELDRLEVIDGTHRPRNCYTSWAGLIGSIFIMALGAVILVWLP